LRNGEQEALITFIADTASIHTVATSTTHGLAETRNSYQLINDDRYIHAEYADNLHTDVERLYGPLNSLNISLSDVPETVLTEQTQHGSGYHSRIIKQLYTTTK